MINSAFLFVNTTLVVGCMVMAFIFLILPLPKNKGLHKYRTSLRFLAGAYLIMALLQFLFMAFNVANYSRSIQNLMPYFLPKGEHIRHYILTIAYQTYFFRKKVYTSK